jgi:hypothetical protein
MPPRCRTAMVAGRRVTNAQGERRSSAGESPPPGVRRQHSLTTGGPVDGTIAVVGLGAPADPSRHCSGDPLRGPPREHEPAAASRSAVHPPPIVPASTDNHATFAHVSSVPVQGTPSRREAGPGNCRPTRRTPRRSMESEIAPERALCAAIAVSVRSPTTGVGRGKNVPSWQGMGSTKRRRDSIPRSRMSSERGATPGTGRLQWTAKG